MEQWISSKEIENYLGVSRKTFINMYPYFSKGIHYRLKNPLNPRSQKI